MENITFYIKNLNIAATTTTTTITSTITTTITTTTTTTISASLPFLDAFCTKGRVV